MADLQQILEPVLNELRSINRSLERHDDRFDALDAQFTGLDAKIDGIDAKFSDKFAELSGDFRLLGVQFENLGSRVDFLAEQMSRFHRGNSELEDRMESVELEQETQEIRLTALERRN